MRTLILLFALSVVGTFGIVCYENKLGFINDRKVSKTTVAKIHKTMDDFGLSEDFVNSFNLDKEKADEVKSCTACAVIRSGKERIQLCWPKDLEACKAKADRGLSCCEKDECNKLNLKELYCYQNTGYESSNAPIVTASGPPVSQIDYKDFKDKLGPFKSGKALPKPENDNFALPCDQCVTIKVSDQEQKTLALCAYKMTPDFCHLGLEKCNNNDCHADCCTTSGCNEILAPGKHKSLYCHHDDPKKSFQAKGVSAEEAFKVMETMAPELADDNDVIELKKDGGKYKCKACATLSKADKMVAFCMPWAIFDKGFCDKEGFKCCKEDFCNYKTKEGTGQMADGDDGGGKDGKSKPDENNGGNQLNINLVFILFSFSTAFFPPLFPISIFPY